MAENPADFEIKLRSYLGELDNESFPWRLCDSALSGRGVFATRDIKTDETVLLDKPILVGPRAHKIEHPSCVVCHRRVRISDVCNKGCALSLCGPASGRQCQDSEDHKSECELIRSWKPKHPEVVSLNLIRALTTIRGLLLPKSSLDIIKSLQFNKSQQTVIEIKKAIEELDEFPSGDAGSVQLLTLISNVLNTNAHETKLSCELDSQQQSLRGKTYFKAVVVYFVYPRRKVPIR